MKSKAPQPELRIIWNPAVILTLVSVPVNGPEVVYATVSESNFGSLHHITLPSNKLSHALARIDKGMNDRRGKFPAVENGNIWQDYPHKGFVTIWEVDVRGKNRTVNLTYDQVGKLLEHFFPNGFPIG